MEVLNSYFANLVFQKVDEKENYAVYACGIEGTLIEGQRYVILFVPSHLAFHAKAKIHELPWVNLQTRTLKNSYKLQRKRWQIGRDIVDFPLTIVSRERRFSVFRGPEGFEFEILLLHDPRKKTMYQYYNTVMLSSALDSFASIFNYKGKSHPINNMADDDSFDLL